MSKVDDKRDRIIFCFITFAVFSFSLNAEDLNFSEPSEATHERITPLKNRDKIEKMFLKKCKTYTDYKDFSGCIKPSFDCTKAKTNTELFICQDNLDARMDNFLAPIIN